MKITTHYLQHEHFHRLLESPYLFKRNRFLKRDTGLQR